MYRKIKYGLPLLSCVFLLSFKTGISKFPTDQNNFPKPDGISNLLFYVQRTINTNTIIYELNVNSEGNINEKNPVKVYWLNFENQKSISPLTYIQRHYAYGLSLKNTDKEKGIYTLNFVSYKKRDFFLIKSHDGKYRVYAEVNNKFLALNKIFVQIDGGSFWFPNVKQIEVSYVAPGSLKEEIEIIKP